MKSKKGVTLIALVITIIVLLILAGVSISLVVGDSGVFTQADQATTKTDRAGAKEALERAIVGKQGDFTKDWNEDTELDFFTWLLDKVTDSTSKSDVLTENGYFIQIEKVALADDSQIIVGLIQKGSEENDETTKYAFELKQRTTEVDGETKKDFLGVDIVNLTEADITAATKWDKKDNVYNETAKNWVDGVDDLIQ